MVQPAPDSDQLRLWALVHSLLQPKARDRTPNACLNRLTNERPEGKRLNLNELTADVREESWPTDNLSVLDAWHTRTYDFDDDRPIVVVEVGARLLLVDGNHRVARWLFQPRSDRQHRVLLIRPRAEQRTAR